MLSKWNGDITVFLVGGKTSLFTAYFALETERAKKVCYFIALWLVLFQRLTSIIQ